MLDAGPVEIPGGNPVQQGRSLDAGLIRNISSFYLVAGIQYPVPPWWDSN